MVIRKSQSNRPVAVDLFAGAGGMGLGFEQAGFDVVAAVEIDPVHCAVHKFNFPGTVMIPLSVEGLSGFQIRMAAGMGDAPVDCVFGGAPCQGFSLIGQRILEDPRNKLVLDFVRIVKELDARTFVFENVKGLTLGKHKKFLVELIKAFDEAGYEVQQPWQVLNAGHYGTPQNRERLILMGARKGEILPDYPDSETNVAGKKIADKNLPVGPTCEDALADLPSAEDYKTLLYSDTVKTNRYGSPSPYAVEMRCLTDDAWHFGYVRDWSSDELTSSARTAHTDISRRRFAETARGSVEPISRFFKLPIHGISNTLRAGTDASRGAFTSPRPIHYKYPRCVTVREMARLHGFPDWFRFHVTKWHGARQVGNAVPPPLARAVAHQIRESLEFQGTHPSAKLAFNQPDLLNLTLSEASEYFGIPVPPNRRDRKSGAIKRKQMEIEQERLNRRVAVG